MRERQDSSSTAIYALCQEENHSCRDRRRNDSSLRNKAGSNENSGDLEMMQLRKSYILLESISSKTFFTFSIFSFADTLSHSHIFTFLSFNFFPFSSCTFCQISGSFCNMNASELLDSSLAWFLNPAVAFLNTSGPKRSLRVLRLHGRLFTFRPGETTE